MENKELNSVTKEQLENARKEAQRTLADRIVQYRDMIVKFDEAIDSYKVLLEVLFENQKRFNKYIDIRDQFIATKTSYETQQRNLKAHLRLLEKAQNNPSKHSAKDILKLLTI